MLSSLLLAVTLAAPLKATWISQSTTLFYLGEHVILTDPVFAETLFFGLARRGKGISIKVGDLPKPELVLLSHLHDDHFHKDSLRSVSSGATLIAPSGSSAYFPKDLGFSKIIELDPWESVTLQDLKVTAVPIRHLGGTWVIDGLWNRSFAAYVVEYQDRAVLFVGDAGVSDRRYQSIAERFPDLDLAFLPIAPVKGPLLKFMHTGPQEAIAFWELLGRPIMIPIHYAGFWGGDEAAIRAYDALSSPENRRIAPGEWIDLGPGEE